MDNNLPKKPLYQFDSIQKSLLQKKFSDIFCRISNIYNQPSATKELVNHGIAVKLSREFTPASGYYQVDRDAIIEYLSEIDFTDFFANTKTANNKDHRVYFRLRNPKSFLTSKPSTIIHFTRYVFKKYCNITSSERLKLIFNKQFSLSITPTKLELRKAIYEVVEERASFTQKFLNLLSDSITKSEIATADDLKNIMEERSYKIVPSQAPLIRKEYPELFLTYSVAGYVNRFLSSDISKKTK